jgi:alcohol dehydrogenase class IV
MMSNLKKFARVAEIMGENIAGLTEHEAAGRAVAAIHQLTKDVGMPQRMRDFGIRKEDIPGFVDHMFSFRRIHVDRNCRKASRTDVTQIYEAAW